MADYDISEAFSAIENELISSMVRNLKRHRAEETELGFEWSQWQVEQLKALEDYRRKNQRIFPSQFNRINQQIRRLLRDSYNDGGTKQEQQILQAVRRGFKGKGTNAPPFTGKTEIGGEFFKINDDKLNALIQATTHDMEKAEIAVLRMANDRYRKVIFNAQVMANTGAGTYEQAVDMATKDFLSSGINCIEYRNGRRVNIKSYAEMALRTAGKRAYLQGEGNKRKEWGVTTVILNKRTNPCPICARFVGRVFIDDVWSGGSKDGISPVTGIKYPLLSEAIKQGLYHPNCKDSHTTYFEGISTPPEDSRYTADELDEIAENYSNQQKAQHAENEAERMERISKFSLDKDNQRIYSARSEQWRSTAEEYEDKVHHIGEPEKNGSAANTENSIKNVANSEDSGIIKATESAKKLREKIMPIQNKTFNETLGISKSSSDLLCEIHEELNVFMENNQKEKLTILNLSDNSIKSQTGELSKIILNNEILSLLKKSPKDSLIFTHVHPDIIPFSKEDIQKILGFRSIKALTLECSDGSRYVIQRDESAKTSLLKNLFDIPEFTMDRIYEEVASEKYPNVDWEKQWGDIGYPFVTECCKRICKYYNLIFERLL